MTDETILDLFWSRSEDAIRATAEKYGTLLTRIARNILRQAEDATLGDTTEMDFDQSVEAILRIVEEKRHD